MPARRRPPTDWLGVLGAAVLFGSLFLTWSHQLPRVEHARFAGAALYGVTADPDALQVYASTGFVLGGLALGLAAAGLWGQRPARCWALAAAGLGLAFVIRAAVHAPTRGLLLAQGSGSHARYVPDPATAGLGETVALIGLVCALVGMLPGAVRRRRVPRRERPETGRVAT